MRKKTLSRGQMTQKRQSFSVGERVRMTFPREPALRDVSDSRLTSEGVVEKVSMRFARTPELAEMQYHIALDSRILGASTWVVMQSQADWLTSLVTSP